MQTATRIPYIQIDDPASESWKLGPVIDILRDGGLGVIPTDTCYMFVTPVDSRNGESQTGVSKRTRTQEVSCSCGRRVGSGRLKDG